MPRSIADLRKDNGGLDNLTDEQIVKSTYGGYQKYYGTEDEYAKAIGYGGAGRGLTMSRLSAGVDSYQGQLYGAAESLARSAGMDGVADAAGRGRKANKDAADYANARAKEQGGIDDWRDVRGIPSGANFAGGLMAQSLPQMAAQATGGFLGGLVGGVPGAIAGGAAVGYGNAFADITDNQREQTENQPGGGRTDPMSAALYAAPYAVVDAFTGIGDKVMGLTKKFARGAAAVEKPVAEQSINFLERGLNDIKGYKGGFARAGYTGLKDGVIEGAGETFQETMNQAGRMAVDPNASFTGEDAQKRYVDSFVGGGVLGSLLGGAGNRGKRFELQPAAKPAPSSDELAATGDAPLGQQGILDERRKARQEMSRPDGLPSVIQVDGMSTATGSDADNAVMDSQSTGIARQQAFEQQRQAADDRQRAQAIKDNADALTAARNSRDQRAGQFGVDNTKKNLNNLFGELEDAHDQGVLDDVGAAQALSFLQGGDTQGFNALLKSAKEEQTRKNDTSVQGTVNRTTGVGLKPYAGKGYAAQFEAAASEPTGTRTTDANGVEVNQTALGSAQNSSGLTYRQEQEALATKKAVSDKDAADKTAAERKAAAARAGESINRTTGVGNKPVAGKKYGTQFEAAASALTGKRTNDANGIEVNETALESVQRESGLLEQKRKDDAATKATDDAAAKEKADLAAAAATAGVNPRSKKAMDLYSQLRDAHREGLISTAALNETTEQLNASKFAAVDRFLKGATAASKAVQTADAQTAQNNLDALQPKAPDATTATAAPTQATAQADPAPTASAGSVATAAPASGNNIPAAKPKPTPAPAVKKATPAERAAAFIDKSGRKQDDLVKVTRQVKGVSTEVEISALDNFTELYSNPQVYGRYMKAMGFDAEGNQVAGPMPFAQIAREEGVSRNAVTKQLARFGVDETTINAAVATPDALDARAGTAFEESADSTGIVGVPKESDITATDGEVLPQAPVNAPKGEFGRREGTLAQVAGEGPVRGKKETSSEKMARIEGDNLIKVGQGAQENTDTATDEGKRQAADNQKRAEERQAIVLNHPSADEARVDWNEHKQEDSPRYEELTPTVRTAFVLQHSEQADKTGEKVLPMQVLISKFEGQLEDADYTKTGSNPENPGATAGVGAATAESTTGRADRAGGDTAAVQPTTGGQISSGETGARSAEPAAQPTVTVKKRRTVERSEAPNSRGASDAKQLTSELTKFLRVGALGRLVNVVQSVSDLPFPPGAAQSIGINAQTQGFVVGGKAYLIADNIAPGAGKAVFMHEVGSHLGVQQLLTQGEFKRLVGTVMDWAGGKAGPEAQKIARAAMARVRSARTSASQYNTELVAYTIEEATLAGYNPMAAGNEGPIKAWMRSVLQQVKAILTKLGMNPDKFGVQDLVDLAYGAARAVQSMDTQETSGAAQQSQGRITDTPAFRKWFGDSKVIDADGKPLVVYHGTVADFDAFSQLSLADKFTRALKMVTANDGKKQALREQGTHFFSSNPELANMYAGTKDGSKILPVYLNLQNPIVYDASTGATTFSDGSTKTIDTGGYDNWMLANRVAFDAANRAGADGIVIKNVRDGGPPSDVYIAFKPNQIKSATGNNGNFNPADPRIQFSQAAETPQAKAINVSHSAIQSAFKDAWTTAGDLGSSFLKKAAFTSDLVNMAANNGLGTAHAYLKAMNAVQTEKVKLVQEVQSVVEDFNKLTPDEQGQGPNSVNIFLRDSTMNKAWGYVPSWKPGVKADPAMKAAYDALSPRAQAVVDRVFKHGDNVRAHLKNAQTATAQREFAEAIAAAEKANRPEQVAKLKVEQEQALKDAGKALEGNWPYAPLGRFGDHVVLAMSERYLQAVKDGNKKLIAELQTDAKHYQVERTDTMRSARVLAESLQNNFPGGHVTSFEKGPENSLVYGGRDALGALTRLRHLVRDSASDDLKLDGTANAAIDKMLRDLHLTLLNEDSARKSGIGRATIAGANKDMMRTFSGQGQAMAHYIATLRMGADVQDSLQAMKDQAEERTAGDTQRRAYYNELLKRHVLNLEYKPNKAVEAGMAMSSIWTLLTNPAHHLTNGLQTVMSTLPQMAGKHGYRKSATALTTAYHELGPILKGHSFTDAQLKAMPADQQAIMTRGWSFKVEDFSKLPKDVQAMAKVLADRGSIGVDQGLELGQFESTPDGKMHVFTTVVDKLRGMAEGVEAVNRLSAAMAAYRLEISNGATPQAATEYAHRIVLETHGDYSGFNAPRIMRHGLGRLLTQFKKYQLIQLSLYAKLGHEAFKGASPEERAVAYKTLAFNLAHLAAIGGMTGLPGFALVAWILGKAFGDKDKPEDAEAKMRRAIGDKNLADLLLRGLPKFLGMDVSTRLGGGDLLTPLPYSEPGLSKKGFESVLLGLSGPLLGGLLPRFADGLGQMSKSIETGKGEDFFKGLEQLVPNGLGNTMKAVRYQANGLTQRNGDTVIQPEDLSVLTSMSQALGLPSNTITDKNYLAGQMRTSGEFYKQRSAAIKQAYVNAQESNNADGMRAGREEWMRMQGVLREQGYAVQPLSVLLKAPAEKRKREDSAVSGVETNKRNRGAVDMLTE